MKGKLVFLLLGALFLFGCTSEKKHTSETGDSQKYTCPMHPQIIKDAPGSCPVCGMDLVPVHDGGGHSQAEDSLSALVKPTNAHVLSTVKTVRPEPGSRTADISLKGVINYNTNNWNSVSARVSGRIERLYIRYNYEMVSKGQKIMEIYSPDLVNAQQELLFLKNNAEPVLLEAAKRKLRFLGASEGQISQVLRTGKVDYTIPVYSSYSGYVAEPQLNTGQAGAPAGADGGNQISSGTGSSMGTMGSSASSANIPSVPEISSGQALQLREGQYVSAGQKLFNLINVNQVWAEFYARPEQLQEFKRGTMVDVTALDIPAQRSRVAVSLIQPYYNEGSNYSLVRAVVPNSRKDWKIGQLITVSRQSSVNGNWLPRTAVIQLGTRYVAFIKRGQAFVPVYIKVNKISGDWVDIGDSLDAGQEAAANAWFLVDSESFIKAERL